MKILAGMTALALASVCAYADDNEDVAKAAKKATGMESYTFKLTIDLEGLPMAQGPIEIEGKHNKDTATYVSGSMMGNDFEAYKKGDKVALNRNGEWRLAGGGGQGGRGGFGGGMMGRNLKSPHEEVADLDKKFKEIKKGDKKETVDGKECSIYSGDLTDDAAKAGLPFGGGNLFGGAAEVTGKARVWIDDDGVIRKYSFESNIKASFNGQDFEINMTRTVDLSKIGDTKVELPDDVKKLFTDEKKDGDKDGEKKDGDKKDDGN